MFIFNTVAVIVLVWLIFRFHKIETLPRAEYLKTIREWQVSTKEEWINEMLIKSGVSELLKNEISKRRNTFNLRQLVLEGLIEHKRGHTWFSGEFMVPIATCKITSKGLEIFKGSLG